MSAQSGSRGLRITIISILATVAVATIAALLSKFAHQMNITVCQGNLHQIGLAILTYENDHGHEFPDTIGHLLEYMPLSVNGLVCPASSDSPAKTSSTQGVISDVNMGGHLSYVYVGKGLTKTAATESTVVAFEPLANHITGMNVLFGDGHLEFVGRKKGRAIAAEFESK